MANLQAVAAAAQDPTFPALVRAAAEMVIDEHQLDETLCEALVDAVVVAVTVDGVPQGLGFELNRVASGILHQAVIWRTRPRYYTPWTDSSGVRAMTDNAGPQDWSSDAVRARLNLYDNHNRHHPFWTWWSQGILPMPTVRELALDLWEMVPTASIPTKDWVALFRAIGFVTADSGVARPTRDVELWRGASPSRSCRISWSADISTAAWFAWRIPRTHAAKRGRLLHARVSPDRLLGYTNDRGEREWLVDPTGLRLGRDFDVVRTYSGSEPPPSKGLDDLPCV